MTPKYKALIQKLDSGPVGNPSADANNSQTRQIMKEAAAALRSYSDPAPAPAADPVRDALVEALRDMRRQFSPFPSEDTERWREQHEACESADHALALAKGETK